MALNLHYVDITYFNTLYNRNTTIRTHNEITFKDGCIVFAGGYRGSKYSIPCERVVSIKPLEEEE